MKVWSLVVLLVVMEWTGAITGDCMVFFCIFLLGEKYGATIYQGGNFTTIYCFAYYCLQGLGGLVESNLRGTTKCCRIQSYQYYEFVYT